MTVPKRRRMPANKRPYFSVIIPVYNAERYLRECLNSIVSQSFYDNEIICVNDGSNDGSLKILKEFACHDPRIRLIDKENEGQAIARNKALDVANGKFILFVDADDFVDKQLCEKVYAVTVRHNSDVVIYDFTSVREASPIRPAKNNRSSLHLIAPDDRGALLRHMGVVWTKCVSRDLIRENDIRFPERRIYEDVLVHWQLVTLARCPYILPERLYFYRIHSSATTRRTDWKLMDRLYIIEEIRKYLRVKNIYGIYKDEFLRTELSTYYWLQDTLDPCHKSECMRLVLGRLRDEHWAYVDSGKPLSWTVKDFLNTCRGSYTARARRAFWLGSRSLYRKFKETIPSI